MSPEELEAKNALRVKTVVFQEVEEVQIRTDGGISEVIEDNHNEINQLVDKLIILVTLIVVGILVWRIGAIGLLAGFLGLQ